MEAKILFVITQHLRDFLGSLDLHLYNLSESLFIDLIIKNNLFTQSPKHDSIVINMYI